MRARVLVAALAIAALLPIGVAHAGYKKSQDITLSVTVLPSVIKPSGSTGDTTFALQEGAHQEVTDTTGQSIDHSYVWVEVNGQKVLAVDPISFYDYDR